VDAPGTEFEATGRYQEAVLACLAEECHAQGLHPLQVIAIAEISDELIGVQDPHSTPPLARAWAATIDRADFDRVHAIVRTITDASMAALEDLGMKPRDLSFRCAAPDDLPMDRIPATQRQAVIDHLVGRLDEGDSAVAQILARLATDGAA